MKSSKACMTALNFLLGNWNTTGQVKASEGNPAVQFQGTDSYELILDGCFILHKVDVMMGSDKTNIIELIGEYNEASKSYQMRSFDNQGNFVTMQAYFDKKGVFSIEGDNMRSQLFINDDNNLSAHWERSEDNKTWHPWMDLKLSKMNSCKAARRDTSFKRIIKFSRHLPTAQVRVCLKRLPYHLSF